MSVPSAARHKPAPPALATVARLGPARGVCWGWAAALFLLYTAFSLSRHYQLGSGGFDLGIFAQGVRGYAELGLPRSDIKGWGFNLYGDHFHPVLVFLVPLYWAWESAASLLVGQACLLAASVVPLARLAVQRMGRPAAHAVAASYGLSFGIQNALAFDFHEVAFAVPLLAHAATALAERRWRAACGWTLPLLLVKEDLSLTVSAVGMVMVGQGQRRSGSLLIGVGLLGFAVIVGALIPAVNPQGVYPYLGPNSAGGALTGVDDIIPRLLSLTAHLFVPTEKVTTLLLLAALTCLLSLFSPLSAICLPTIVVRFLSDSSYYWGTSYHYSLVLMPMMFAAALDSQPALLRSRFAPVRALGRHAAAAMLVAAAPLAPHQPLQNFLLHPVSALVPTSHSRAAYEVMSRVPNGASVRTTNNLAAHLTHRTRVVIWPLSNRETDWVITDTTASGISPAEHQAHLEHLMTRGYEHVETKDGIVLMRRADHSLASPEIRRSRRTPTAHSSLVKRSPSDANP